MKNFSVIIPAAGSGVRFGGHVKKQFLTITHQSLLELTLNKFVHQPHLHQIIVVLPANEMEQPSFLLLQKKYPQVVFVKGGATRAQSVHQGFLALSNLSDDHIVLIHDAVRPLVDAQLIQRVLVGVEKYGAALPVVPIADTVKQVDGDCGHIIKTIPRSDLRGAQTPQGFLYALLKQAYSTLDFSDEKYTDESLLVEALGQKVYGVEGDVKNFKITTMFDFQIADFMMRENL